MARRWLVLLSVLSTPMFGVLANGQPSAESALPDTGISCPVGFIRVIQLHCWEISPAASEKLFGDSTARVLPAGWKAFRGPELRKHIIRLASVGTQDVKGGWASQAFFGNPTFRHSYLDSTGNGFAMFVRDIGERLVGSACVIVDGAASAHVGALPVEEGRSIIIGIRVDGRPHAVALRVATVPQKSRRREAQAFREGVAKVAVSPTHNLLPTNVTASIDSCLRMPILGAGSAADRW